MSEKVYVRKVETWTVSAASEPIEVNVEALRNCEPPYEGNSDEELVQYLYNNVYMDYDFYENEHNQEVYGEDDLYQLSFEDVEYSPYSDSREKFGDFWTDIGVPNEEYRKMGGFEVFDHSRNDY